MRSRFSVVSGALAAAFVVGCTALAGVSDFEVDPCFGGGCADGPMGTEAGDTSTGQDSSSLPDGAPTVDGSDPDADASLPSPGGSNVTVSAAGVVVGKLAIATLTARSDSPDGGAPGAPIARTGAKVVFTASGGTSVVTIGAVVDNGDGTYSATLTGVTEGTPLDISATLDGASLKTPPAKFEVGRVRGGLSFALEAANADRNGNAGGKNCPAAGLALWKDLTAGSLSGTLAGFNNVCSGSGWQGNGTPADPHRLVFDGVDDHVDFGASNPLPKWTVLAWIRKTGTGVTATSGTGGLTGVTPILAKGAAEAEVDAIDINYYLGIAASGALASDYEANPGSGNSPLTGGTVLADDTWYMVGATLDASAGERSLYLDGALEATGAAANPPSGAATSVFVVGGAKRSDSAAVGCAGSTGCGRFHGDIAVVLTYDRALPLEDIKRNCQTFASRFGITTCPN